LYTMIEAQSMLLLLLCAHSIGFMHIRPHVQPVPIREQKRSNCPDAAHGMSLSLSRYLTLTQQALDVRD
jgi:hypothetical protein